MVRKTLDWLQGLRGVAALLVVLTHARFFLSKTPYEGISEAMFRPGAVGVDLFFLISGFIMVYTTADSDGSARYSLDFFIKRLSRIWPVYAVLAILGVQSYYAAAYFLDTAHVHDMLRSLLFLPVDPRKPPYYGLPYGLGWTLNFEIYFYLVFGISMLFGRYRWATFFGWLALSLIAFPYLKTGAVEFDVQYDYHFRISVVNQITNPIIWTFAAGVVVGLVYRARLELPDNLASRAALSCAIVAAIWWPYSGMGTFHGLAGWGAPLAVAFLLLAVASKTIAIPVPRPLVWLGKVSFSLYLAHPIAQEIPSRLLRQFDREDLTHTWSHIFATTVLSLVFAAIAHELLERRLSEWVKRRLLSVCAPFLREGKRASAAAEA